MSPCSVSPTHHPQKEGKQPARARLKTKTQ